MLVLPKPDGVLTAAVSDWDSAMYAVGSLDWRVVPLLAASLERVAPALVANAD